MFTGIIEEIGTIKSINKGAANATLTIECKKVLEDLKLGDSIAIEGVCQTVIKFDSSSFIVEVSNETLKVTRFSDFKSGDKVNLERALTLQTRLGGHLVSGHVDGVAKIKNIQALGDFYNLEFEVEKSLCKYIVKKGSVTINGISLTVANISNNLFSAAIIPHTFEKTTLNSLKIGSFVNIETDILAKYVENFLSTGNNKSIDENFLKENGFF